MQKRSLYWLAISLGLSVFIACKKDPGPVVVPPADQPVFYAWTQFVLGADLSYVNQVQDYGGVYRDSAAVTDPFKIFKKHGANVVRVRLWYNPQWQAALNGGRRYNDLADVEKTIQRAKSAGLAVSLDLHYSDVWADPGHQETPAAWTGLALPALQDSVYQYTLALLNHLESQNLTPEMIQIGNETNQGMLFPAGQVVNNNWAAFASLLKSGIQALRDFSATSVIHPQIILHVAQYKNADYFASHLQQNGVTDYDILGISHYDIWSEGYTFTQIENTTRSLRLSYGKKVMIVETAAPWTSQNADNYPNIIPGTTGFAGYPVSPTGQLDYLKALTQALIKGGGSGIIYWEPAWITSSLHDLYDTGSGWDNMTLFDAAGNSLPGLDYMTYPYKF
ncbi:MAG: glycosyl hydrolase 53 family protein [Saprospiraceae bacterium]